MTETFQARQQAFRTRRADHRLFAPAAGTIVVVPSITMAPEVVQRLTGMRHYEERMLWILLTLDRPGTRVVYLSSLPIDPAIIDYYLEFLPDPEQARARLHTVHLGDPDLRPLTEKVLDRPDIMDRVGDLVGAPGDGWVQPYIVSPAERALAERIRLPLYGPDPDLGWLGSKSGARKVAGEAGVAVPRGVKDLTTLEDVERAVDLLSAATPAPARAVVKLNDSSSGLGNAIVELGRSGRPLNARPVRFTADGETWTSFAVKLGQRGGVAEELIEHDRLLSPSVQVEITPGGTWHILGTHLQRLGGRNRHTYLGCQFPAADRHREMLQRYAEQVAAVLAARGVIGSFGIDFLVVPGDGGEDLVYLAEINLRLGGTTHPLGMVTLATHADYDRPTGTLYSHGRSKFYLATDNVIREQLVGTSPSDALGWLRKADLALERGAGTGVTLHMLGALGHHGKLGFTCVGDSQQEAEDLYDRMLELLDGMQPTNGVLTPAQDEWSQ